MTSTLKFIETSKLPTDVGEFTVHAFTDEKDKLMVEKLKKEWKIMK